MSSCLTLRQSRSMNRLSIHRPRPSILTSTPTDSTASRNASLVNWLPWSVLEINGWRPLTKAPVQARMQNSLSRLLDNSHDFHSHQLQQSLHPFAIHQSALSLQQGREASAAIHRVFQMQLVQPSHQGEVFLAFRHRLVIEAAARNAHQLALPLQAQFGA